MYNKPNQQHNVGMYVKSKSVRLNHTAKRGSYRYIQKYKVFSSLVVALKIFQHRNNHSCRDQEVLKEVSQNST